MTTIVVSGALANKPWNGGAAWTRLSWILGLRRLGFDVLFVEQLAGGTRALAEDGATADTPGVAFFTAVASRFGLAGTSTLIAGGGRQSFGLAIPDLLERCEDAALLVNISGHLTYPPVLERCRRRAFVDLDPGFTQIWHDAGVDARLAGHDVYFTVGENVGTPACSLPTGRIPWQPVRQPVLLDEWPVCPAPSAQRLTTVSSWRGPYGPVEHDGARFGVKAHEFRRLVDLPRLVPQTCEIALEIDPGDAVDRERLESSGWHLADPLVVARDPDTFREYVQGSWAELSAAQGVYVHTATGWISDRTTRYLATGRPAIVQDTGFDRRYARDGGLLAFATIDEAREAVERVARDYEEHAAAARAVAEQWFASDVVLRDFIDRTGMRA